MDTQNEGASNNDIPTPLQNGFSDDIEENEDLDPEIKHFNRIVNAFRHYR